ncbi:hypothetical protein ACROYT_G020061 [Oculina patagonica]
MKKSCCSLVYLVLLTLFKGLGAGIDEGYSEWSEWSHCSKTCGHGVQQQSRTCTNPKPEREMEKLVRNRDLALPSRKQAVTFKNVITIASSFTEQTEREHLPSYSETHLQQLHSVPPRQSRSNSEVLQIVNLQSTSHSQALGAECLPNTRERSVSTANPPELLTVTLPPLNPQEVPPPPYSSDETSPPYSREELPPPYSGEELPPSYSGGEHTHAPYAVTSLV